MANKIVYIGNFIYPDGNAAGKRVSSNGKLLSSQGYEVYYIGRGKNKDANNMGESFPWSFEIYNNKQNIKAHLLSNRKILKKIKDIISDIGINNVKFVILYGELNNSFLNLKLINWCHKNNIKVLIDCVEWWSENDGNIIFRTVKNLNTNFLIKYVNKKADGIITISNYLMTFYSEKGIPTVIIPPLVDSLFYSGKSKTSENIKVIYAGFPFRKGIKNISHLAMKDRLDKAIDILLLVKKSNPNLLFDIYGITYEDYIFSVPRQRSIIEKNLSWIKFHGELENDFILKEIIKSDASILLRDDNLVSRAGFSTKLVESISLGTPVITTDVGDIDRYLKNNNIGLILSNKENINTHVDYVNDFLRSIKSMTNVEKNDYNIFYYKNYESKLKSFLENLSN
ncbi:glycosyltransferase [Enterococcus casseliflavus]|uniref:glycosyltransferase n=1 Tax=Enterococcus casseliflavus TaxID=37734 RepID=UPI001C4753C8|nr:glycosyltransferase [Enterococcus casseliflavus]MBV6374314.1 glycosyltransferase family 4 protein [Enterococcus casseliflavus]